MPLESNGIYSAPLSLSYIGFVVVLEWLDTHKDHLMSKEKKTK